MVTVTRPTLCCKLLQDLLRHPLRRAACRSWSQLLQLLFSFSNTFPLQDSQDLSLSSWSLRFAFIIFTFTLNQSHFHFQSLEFSLLIIQIFILNNSTSPVLSPQSSRSRRRQFSTTTTVRAPPYPQAARCNINIKSSTISNQYNNKIQKQRGSVSIFISKCPQYQNLRYQLCLHYQIYTIPTMFIISSMLTKTKASKSLQWKEEVCTRSLICRLTGSWTLWWAKTRSTSPPSLRGLPSMLPTRISLDFLKPPSQKFQICKHFIYWPFLIG